MINELTETSKLIHNDSTANDNYGESVSISGDYMIVGAGQHDSAGKEDAGSAYIYRKSEFGSFYKSCEVNAWDAAKDDHFGSSVSISGDFAAVGAPGDDILARVRFPDHSHKPRIKRDQGSVYIFKGDDRHEFDQYCKVTATDGRQGDGFGHKIAIDGAYLAVAAKGAVYIFKDDGHGHFTQVTKLTRSELSSPSAFGHRVDLQGDYLIVGCEPYQPAASPAYIYKKTDTDAFTAIATLSVPSSGFQFGSDVAINAQYAVVGDIGNDDDSGKAFLYKNDGTDEFKLLEILRPSPLNQCDGAYFGNSIDLDGDTVVVGAAMYGYWGRGIDNAAAYVYRPCDSGDFVEISKHIASDEIVVEDTSQRDDFGRSVGVGDGVVVVGAPKSDENGTDSGSVYLYDIMEVDSYRIQQFGGGHLLRATIWLYNRDHKEIGAIKFYSNSADVPPNDIQYLDDLEHFKGHTECHRIAQQYQETIDLLRNEKAIYLHYNSIDRHGYLSTMCEPVGEGE